MAVCLQYQSVYVKRDEAVVSAKVQVFAAILLLAILGVRVWTKLEATDLGYQLARERQRAVSLDMERRELELHLSVLLRPDALARTAREKLGLFENSSDQTIKIAY